jgi:hypothetical protein
MLQTTGRRFELWVRLFLRRDDKETAHILVSGIAIAIAATR